MKVLERLKERFEKEYPYCNIWGNEVQVIENLIKGYKELDKENTRQHELLGKIHEKYQKDYIPKSKVREKIEELKNNLKDELDNLGYGLDIVLAVSTLEELLQEGDDK